MKDIETIPRIKVHLWVLENSFTLTVKVGSSWRINKREREREYKTFPIGHLGKDVEGIFPGKHRSLVHSEIFIPQ